MNDPQYSSVRVILIIILVAVVGYFAYNTGHQNALEGTGKVLPGSPNKLVAEPTSNLAGIKLPLTPNFAGLCADGQPRIELVSPNSGDFQIGNTQLTLQWMSCNIPQMDAAHPGSVTVSLIHDGAKASKAYYKNFTGHDYNLTQAGTPGTLDDGSENFSLQPVAEGGLYKIHLEAFGSSAGSNSQVVYTNTGATYDTPNFMMFYENPSYKQTTGTVTYNANSFFRYPKNPSVVTVTLNGAGGGGGGAGGIIPWFHGGNEWGGYAGGGEAGGSKTSVLSNVIPGQVASLLIGAGGNGGAKGDDAVLYWDNGDIWQYVVIETKDGHSGDKGGSTQFKIPVLSDKTNAWIYAIADERTADGGAGGGAGGGAIDTENGYSSNPGVDGTGGSTPNNGAGIDGQSGGQGGEGGSGPGGAGGDGGWEDVSSQAGKPGKITISWVPVPGKDNPKADTPVQGN